MSDMASTVRGALIAGLPEDTPSDVIETAVLSVLQALHAPWWPATAGVVVGSSSYVNLRATAGGAVIGTLLKGAPLRAGFAEGGWKPVLVHGWVSGEKVG